METSWPWNVRLTVLKAIKMMLITLLYLKWITNKDWLYSTGNSAQCYVAAWMGWEFEGQCIYVLYMTEPLYCPPETITTLLIGYTPIQNKKLNLKKMILISPFQDFKMTARTDCTVSAYSPLPLSVKALPHWLISRKSWPLDRWLSSLQPPIPIFWHHK